MSALLERTAAAARRRGGGRTALILVVAVFAVLSVTAYLTSLPQLTSSSTTEAAVRLALPIMLAALGGLWAERSGVINIGLEGMMILGTWGAAWGGYQWGPWAALLFGALFGALGGLLHALATVTFGVNHIVSGVAINLLGMGVTEYLATLVFEPLSQNPRQSPRVGLFTTYQVGPVSDALGSLEDANRIFVSDLAGILRGLVISLSPLVILAFLLIPVSYLVLWRTAFGLRLRSCGESPVAAESLGVNVYLHKYIAVVVSGAMAGLGGAALVLNPGQAGYLEGQTNGRGFIGLAAMIFGNWRPGGLLAGSAMFGYTDGLQLRQGGSTVHALLYAATLALAGVVVWQLLRRRWRVAAAATVGAVVLYSLYWSTEELPDELTAYAPHLTTLVVLAVATQRLRIPAADGMIYRRGDGG